MSIFKKRPLSLILCIILGGFSLFSLFPLLLRVIMFALTSAITIFLLISKAKKISKIISLLLILSALLSSAYFDFYLYEKSTQNEVETFATVISASQKQNYNEITVKTSRINGKYSFGKRLIIKDYSFNDLNSGNLIIVTAKIEALESGEDFDYKSYYTAKGISGFINNTKEICVTDDGLPPISYYFTLWRNKLSSYAEDACDKESAGLLSALLLGDKTTLDTKLNSDFRRIGISHILALSGTHLTILCGGLSALLSIFSINKRTRYIITSLFCIFFMLITGCLLLL